jgi:acyl-CoA synthetase (AMP-forming)/AMP-acid ligase II
VVATTVGRPVPGVELEVVDDDGGMVVTGEVGRVRLRSGAVMRGYLGDLHAGEVVDAAATAEVLDDAGWVTTGDLGWVGTDGNLRLVGRSAEMYIRGGYNVYPAEVEAIVGGHPGVAEVAVVGVADPVLGEIGAAVVVPVPGAPPLELGELRALCKEALADYKAPDRLVIVDQLPLTAMSKVDKRALSDELSAAAATVGATATALPTTTTTPNAKVGS